MNQFYVYVDWTTEEEPRPFYVGKGNTNRLNRRERNKHHVHIADKYGFKRIVVFETPDEHDAYLKEIDFIKLHKTFVFAEEYQFGCNYSMGGLGGNTGWHPTPEQRQKLKAIQKQLWQDPAERKKRVDARNRESTNEKLRPKARNSQLKNWLDPEYRASQIEAFKKTQARSDVKEKKKISNSLASKQQWQNKRSTILASMQTPEYREKQRLAHLGKPQRCGLCRNTGHKRSSCHKKEIHVKNNLPA